MESQVIDALRLVDDHHKLVILLGESGASKPAIFKGPAPGLNAEYVDLNLLFDG